MSDLKRVLQHTRSASLKSLTLLKRAKASFDAIEQALTRSKQNLDKSHKLLASRPPARRH